MPSTDSAATRDALASCFSQLQPRMTAIAMRLAPDRAAAEDIVQNAFEKALRNLDQFAGRSRLSTWVHRIVVNESLMWLRSERRRWDRQLEWNGEEIAGAACADSASDPLERLASERRTAGVHAGIDALPPQDREVLRLCALGDLSYQQFCAERGLDVAAVKSRAFRARRRLRARLAPV